VKVEPTIMKISDEDKVEVANVGFVVNFRRIESIDLDELIVEPSED
jgi:hypothetical protein